MVSHSDTIYILYNENNFIIISFGAYFTNVQKMRNSLLMSSYCVWPYTGIVFPSSHPRLTRMWDNLQHLLLQRKRLNTWQEKWNHLPSCVTDETNTKTKPHNFKRNKEEMHSYICVYLFICIWNISILKHYRASTSCFLVWVPDLI